MQTLLFLFQTAPSQPEGGAGLWNIVFIGAAFAIIYFMMIRPQRKAQQDKQDFWGTLKKGKKVVTIGGIHGIIMELSDTTVSLMVSPKILITVQRECISMEYSQAANNSSNNSNATTTTNESTKEQPKESTEVSTTNGK